MIRPFDMGENDYYSAMASPRWRATRERVIERDGHKCQICGCKENLQVHHIRYKNDYMENDFFNTQYLVTLCRPCHEIITDAVKEAKLLKVEVPMDRSFSDDYSIRQAFYYAEQKHIVNVFFKLWLRTLRSDCERVSFRDKNYLKHLGNIVVCTLMAQTKWLRVTRDPVYYGGPSYIEAVTKVITDYLAKTYNREMASGLSPEAFKAAYKLNDAQLAKVKKNAQRLRGGDNG